MFSSPDRVVSVTVPLGILLLELPEPYVLLVADMSWFCGCCVPGLVAPMVAPAVAPVVAFAPLWLAIWPLSIVVELPVVELACGAGCCVPGLVVPMVAFGLSVAPSCCCNACTSVAQVPAALAAPAASR